MLGNSQLNKNAMLQAESWLITLQGVVQGVGCRPKIKHLADRNGICGWVRNQGNRVVIYCEGLGADLEQFAGAVAAGFSILEIDKDQSHGQKVYGTNSFDRSSGNFQILGSQTIDDHLMLTPDAAPCELCLEELFSSSHTTTDSSSSKAVDRRAGYPFISCSECGPRYAIAHGAPFDRINTSMDSFQLCRNCDEEFSDPEDRRHHAQTLSCPDCGPQLKLLDGAGEPLFPKQKPTEENHICDRAIQRMLNTLVEGGVIAVKTGTGFQLVCCAESASAVARLRELKQRQHKPFALMVKDLEEARELCQVTQKEQELLSSSVAPLVIMQRNRQSQINLADNIAADNPYLALMLPSHGIYHLLMQAVSFPLIVTSANRSGESIAADDRELLAGFSGKLDLIVSHTMAVVRALDDSIFQVIREKPLCLRAGRGLAPVVFDLSWLEKLACEEPKANSQKSALALGAELKNTVAVFNGSQIIVSHYHGDLESTSILNRQKHSVAYLLGKNPKIEGVVSDLHPHSQRAEAFSQFIDGKCQQHLVQHHVAHARAVQVEHQIQERHLAVVWDGFGFGVPENDQQAPRYWGSEFLLIDGATVDSVGYFESLPLLGGDQAMREPRRMALAALWPTLGEKSFTTLAEKQQSTSSPLFSQLEEGIWQALLDDLLASNKVGPSTRAAGRWFDAVSCLLGLVANNRYEGDAAMQLQFLAETAIAENERVWDVEFEVKVKHGKRIFDPASLLPWLMNEGIPSAEKALGFHQALVKSIVSMADDLKVSAISLSGGCFQNRLLTNLLTHALQKKGIAVYWSQKLAVNDGNLAAGQAYDWVLTNYNKLNQVKGAG